MSGTKTSAATADRYETVPQETLGAECLELFVVAGEERSNRRRRDVGDLKMEEVATLHELELAVRHFVGDGVLLGGPLTGVERTLQEQHGHRHCSEQPVHSVVEFTIEAG